MVNIGEVLRERDKEKRDKLYNKYVDENKPKIKSGRNCFNAFLVGGIICALGQLINELASLGGASKETADLITIIGLIGLSAVCTSFGWYARLVRVGGAGTIVPITGFSNGVCAAAIEYRRENLFEGIGCQIFSIAGPVILYGIVVSWGFGVIYYILR